MNTDFDAWLETAKEVGQDFLSDLNNDEREIATACIKDMASLKAKAIMSQPATYGNEMALIESTLQDLKAIVSLDVMKSLRELARRSAGQVLPLIEGLFSKLI